MGAQYYVLLFEKLFVSYVSLEKVFGHTPMLQAAERKDEGICKDQPGAEQVPKDPELGVGRNHCRVAPRGRPLVRECLMQEWARITR